MTKAKAKVVAAPAPVKKAPEPVKKAEVKKPEVKKEEVKVETKVPVKKEKPFKTASIAATGTLPRRADRTFGITI